MDAYSSCPGPITTDRTTVQSHKQAEGKTMASKVLVVGGNKETEAGTIESVLTVTGTSQDVHSCLATDCMVVMHADYEDVSIERGLWWIPEHQMLMLAVLHCSQTP